MDELHALRTKIDAIDHELLRVLNERARLALEVGAIKHRNGLPFYAPDREEQLLRRLIDQNQGPLKNKAIRSIYREIISASLALEKEVIICCLGPEHGPAHHAACSKFGSSVHYTFVDSIESVFSTVKEGNADCGVVLLEDGKHGPANETLDALSKTDLTICAEIYSNMQSLENTAKATQRFLVLSKTMGAATDNDCTSLLLRVSDEPGALIDALEPFRTAKINLRHLASRPASKGSHDVFFFVDIEGHVSSKAITDVLQDLARRCRTVKILGSYPRPA